MFYIMVFMPIPFDDFKKVELRVGKILSAERVEGSEKLLKLAVDLGEKDEAGVSVPRQIVAGIGKAYDPASLVGRSAVFVANLEPRVIMGLESRGMILAASGEIGPIILTPDREVLPGSVVQ